MRWHHLRRCNINLHLTSQDGEGLDAIEHFFCGMVGGVLMELGALDGKAASVSRDFLPLQWKRVLIDGNPIYIDGLKTESADAFSAVAAVCAQPQFVHYLPGPYVGGIVEFMTPEFINFISIMFGIGQFREATSAASTGKMLIPIIWGSVKCTVCRFLTYCTRLM